MSLPFHLPLWILGLVFVYLLPHAAKAYKRHRQLLWVRCPETKTDVLVQLRREPALAGGASEHAPLPVTDCSRWPGKKGCSQSCMRHTPAPPDAT